MTSFNVGGHYTRDQVRAALGLPPMSDRDWATGYAQYQARYSFSATSASQGAPATTIPTVGWTTPDWFGKTGSTPDQPMIEAMVTSVVTTHVFWRGRDRAPFTYAGVGIAEGVWDTEPVEVLWRFKAAAIQSDPAATVSPTPVPEEHAAPAFRHGPAPSFGFKQFLAEDGECWLHLMVLRGAVDALFPHLAPTATGRGS